MQAKRSPSGPDSLGVRLNKLRGRQARSVVILQYGLTSSGDELLMEITNRFSETHQNIELRLECDGKILMGCGLTERQILVFVVKEIVGVNKAWLMDEEAVLVCSPRIVPPEKITQV